MADLARALQTPMPGQQGQQSAAPPQQQPASQGAGEKAAITREANAKREAKNERDRLRRKAQRAAALKAAASKRKKKKAVVVRKARAQADAMALPVKKRRRGRPPGARNKPKVGLAVALVPAPGVLPRGRPAKMASADSLLTQINLAVSLLNAMPEHARKVVLDAVK